MTKDYLKCVLNGIDSNILFQVDIDECYRLAICIALWIQQQDTIALMSNI